MHVLQVKYLGKFEEKSLVIHIVNILQTNANKPTKRVYNMSLWDQYEFC
jgi:hypothetical protein